jgi:hypothetical protein
MSVQSDDVIVLQDSKSFSVFLLIKIFAVSDETFFCFGYQIVVEITIFQALSAYLVSEIILNLFNVFANSQ